MARRSIIPPRTSTGRPRVSGGFSIGSAQPRFAATQRNRRPQEPPKSHAIKTDNAMAEMRRVYRTAISGLAQQFEALLGAAEDATEQGFWAAATERLWGE